MFVTGGIIGDVGGSSRVVTTGGTGETTGATGAPSFSGADVFMVVIGCMEGDAGRAAAESGSPPGTGSGVISIIGNSGVESTGGIGSCAMATSCAFRNNRSVQVRRSVCGGTSRRAEPFFRVQGDFKRENWIYKCVGVLVMMHSQ